MGVNTGEVLAGSMGREYTVIGDTVNVASRLQAAGRPGSVTVGERTYRATRDVVEYRPLEPLDLKGKAEPVPAWEAVGAPRGAARRPRRSGATRRRWWAAARRLRLLESLYGRVVREGRPHLVTVVGQAGVGKSRLRASSRARSPRRPDAPTVRQGRCLPYGSSIVFWALGEVAPRRVRDRRHRPRRRRLAEAPPAR